MHRLRQTEVAELLGLSARQVHNLVKQGLPRHADGGKTFYDGPLCVAWYVRFKVTEAESNLEPATDEGAKARLDELRGDILVIELQKAREQVLPVEYAVHQLEQLGERLRSKLVALPSRWAPLLVGAKTIPEIAARLESAVDDVLKSLVVVADEMDFDEVA